MDNNRYYPLSFIRFFVYRPIYFLNIPVFFDNWFEFDLKSIDFVERFSPTAFEVNIVYRLIAVRGCSEKLKNLFLDIDECSTKTDNCNALATCTNTDGSFTCACNTGYTGDGVKCAGKFLTITLHTVQM